VGILFNSIFEDIFKEKKMKIIVLLGFVLVTASSAFALDMKETLLNAAKDKKNQEQAKEIAQKGVEYIKAKVETKPEVTPVPAPAPVVEKSAPADKKAKAKKKAKKKKVN
jgi:hypothetical protein